MRVMQQIRSATTRRGFTLVELMIAMVLVGILTAVIYTLFVSTSDALTDVQSKSEALDRARFGLDIVRTDLQAAASQSTPNAEADPWFEPDSADLPWVHGLSNYVEREGVDDITGEMGDEVNPRAGFSQFVVLGAYDVPTSFFVRFPELDAGGKFIVEGTERGVGRLLGYDPFDTRANSSINLSGFASGIEARAPNRVLRVTDDQGFSQVVPITSATVQGATDWAGDQLSIEVSNLQFRQGDERAGFEATTEDDVSFDAAMLDAYWYHVRAAPDDARNFQLVRQRIDAGELISSGGIVEADGFAPMVVADYVVDFRVWFDCVGSGESTLNATGWQGNWEVTSDTCLTGTSPEPERARVAHIRLSTRTEGENPNRPHYTLVDNWEGFEEEDGQMRTFDLYADAEGSTGVITVQSTVELANFAMRRIN